MLNDDDIPLKKPELVLRVLDSLSVAALRDYIAELEAEIERARAEITRRGSARAQADALFGASSSREE